MRDKAKIPEDVKNTKCLLSGSSVFCIFGLIIEALWVRFSRERGSSGAQRAVDLHRPASFRFKL